MAGGSRGTVLVVDDEASIRLLCRVNLELDGHEVLEASTVAEARARLEETPIDVVLLDLHLGDETGYDLIAECAARSPRVPVAVVTGSTDPSSAERAGAHAVLSKPFAIDELAATVAALAAAAAAAR
jgi:DNA-binding NtrC family response regulator